jgi:hypothetical protein
MEATMVKIKTKLIETLSFSVSVLKSDINGGACMLISKCMHKIAIERALRKLDPRGGDHRTRVDGGNVKFNLRGYHWIAFAPKKLKTSLIVFDKEKRARARAERDGVEFVSKVVPHTYRVEAHRTSKIEPFTRERQEQVNEARRRRIAAGKPDKRNYDIRHRVEGMGAV